MAYMGIRRHRPGLFALMAWVCLNIAHPLIAQSYLPRLYTSEDGLVTNRVTALHQDARGYLWIGSHEGLSRFDGVQFDDFAENERLLNERITGFTEDHSGQVWIGTRSGLARFDGSDFTFLTTDDGLLSNSIKALVYSPKGKVWVATDAGLSIVDGDKVAHLTTVDGLLSPQVYSLSVGASDRLWIGTAEGVCVHQDKALMCYSTENGLSHPVVHDVLEDHRERVWVATEAGVDLLLPGSSHSRFINLDHLSNLAPRRLLESKNGTVWIAGESGMYYIDKNMNVTSAWDDRGWSGTALFQDREGSVWAGTDGQGVIQFRKRTFFTPSLNLAQDEYRSVFQDTDSTVWIGTAATGLYRVNGTDVFNWSPALFPFLKDITSIHEASDSTLWIGTAEGLIQYIGETFLRVDRDNGTPFLSVSTIHRDASNTMWIADSTGITAISEDTTYTINLPEGMDPKQVYSLHDDAGRLYITSNQGLSYYDGQTVRSIPSLSGHPTTTITTDPTAHWWIGTDGYGMFRYDPMDESIVDTLHIGHGLNSGRIHTAFIDRQQQLWIGTPAGINRFDLKSYLNNGDKTLRAYGSQDGLSDIIASGDASRITNDGLVWIGTSSGLVRFDPDSLAKNTTPPLIFLSNLYLNQDTLPVDSLMHLNEPATFSGTNNSFTFEVQGISHVAAEHLVYSYRLRGLSDTWSSPTSNPIVTYEHLPAGEYTFEARARNSDGTWSSKPAAFTFQLSSIVWETAWFAGALLGGALTLLLGLFLIRRSKPGRWHKQYKTQLSEQSKELEHRFEDLLKLRDEALQDAHARSAFLSKRIDQLRAPAHGITGMTQLLTLTALDNEQRDYVTSVLKSSQVLLNQIETLLTVAYLGSGQLMHNSELFDLPVFVQDCVASMQPAAQARQLELRYYVQPDTPEQIESDREHIRHILKHLLSNAVRFTEAGMIYLDVSVDASTSPHTLHFDVYDTGAGMDPATLQEITERFRHSDLTEKTLFSGNAIGLILAFQLIRGMNGDLAVESSLETGSTFRFSLPLQTDPPAQRPNLAGGSLLAGKHVTIALGSEQASRYMDLLCRSFGMRTEIAPQAAYSDSLPETDVILSETAFSPDRIAWIDIRESAYDEAPTSSESCMGLLVGPDLDVQEIEWALRSVFKERSTV